MDEFIDSGNAKEVEDHHQDQELHYQEEASEQQQQQQQQQQEDQEQDEQKGQQEYEEETITLEWTDSDDEFPQAKKEQKLPLMEMRMSSLQVSDDCNRKT